MSNQGVLARKMMFPPEVGMESLVGIWGDKYPLPFGNYCSIAGGPYLCNIWSENLREWARRHPDSGPIEVTVVSHVGKSMGFVSDRRLESWCNDKPCVTGAGWPSVAVMEETCTALGFDATGLRCGCESDNESPRLSESWSESEGAEVRCHRCDRRWGKCAKESEQPKGRHNER